MGYQKSLMDLDFSPSGLSICVRHLTNTYLVEAVRARAEAGECFVCGRASATTGDEPFAVPLDAVTEQVLAAIRRHYSRAIDGVPWDGGYMLPTDDTSDVVQTICEFAFDEESAGHVQDTIVGSLEDEALVDRRTDLIDSAEFLWSEFSETVRYRSRFAVLGGSHDRRSAADHVHSVETFVATMADAVDQLDLVTVLPTSTPFFRGRLMNDTGEVESSAAALGPAPRSSVTANRMSPPGIVMFYASSDAQTAIQEIAGHGPGPYAKIGEFRSTKPLNVIDLTGDALTVDYFDAEGFNAYRASRILKYFVEEITKPVIPDGREHREYVPTQVLTEFLRWGLGKQVDGIVLPSAQSHRPTYVMFFDSTAVSDESASKEASAAQKDSVFGLDMEGDAPVFTLAKDRVTTYEVHRCYEGKALKSAW